ncbi:MAG: hypothetical protein ABL885_00230 [Methylophilaceae bacterium]
MREIFEDAYIIALPYIDPARGVGGIALTHHAFVVLRESFPGLLAQDLPILIRAIESVFKSHRLKGHNI